MATIKPVPAQILIDQSGRRSRGGYRFQDLCALRYCIRVAASGDWEEIWCESHDDIVLFRSPASGERYRFIQVKFEFSASQHWSCSQICTFEKTKKDASISDSIIVKLFDSDRLGGESDYRLAVNEGVSKDLRPFHYRWNQVEPVIDLNSKAAKKLIENLRSWVPASGKSVSDYVGRFGVEQHSADNRDMEWSVMMELADLLKDRGYSPLVDELEKIFRLLYSLVFRAASAAPGTLGNPERIVAKEFLEEANLAVESVVLATDKVASSSQRDQLKEILEGVGLSDPIVLNALALRREYFGKWRTVGDSQTRKVLEDVYSAIRAICTAEMVRAVEDPTLAGRTLLTRMLDSIEDYHQQLGPTTSEVNLGLLHGMLYFLIGRGSVVLNP